MEPASVRLGPAPDEAEWLLLFRAYGAAARAAPALRRWARWYFLPHPVERWRGGAVYRALGVAAFGRIVPTGGVAFRRATGFAPALYRLPAPTVAGARGFLFRTCAVETAHAAVFALVTAAAVLSLSLGRPRLAAGGMVANIVVNACPILLQRYTRVRIVRLLARQRR